MYLQMEAAQEKKKDQMWIGIENQVKFRFLNSYLNTGEKVFEKRIIVVSKLRLREQWNEPDRKIGGRNLF